MQASPAPGLFERWPLQAKFTAVRAAWLKRLNLQCAHDSRFTLLQFATLFVLSLQRDLCRHAARSSLDRTPTSVIGASPKAARSCGGLGRVTRRTLLLSPVVLHSLCFALFVWMVQLRALSKDVTGALLLGDASFLASLESE